MTRNCSCGQPVRKPRKTVVEDDLSAAAPADPRPGASLVLVRRPDLRDFPAIGVELATGVGENA
jgi:hypothetical protein